MHTIPPIPDHDPTVVRLATIKPGVLSDGPGVRTSVYFQGCPIGRSATPCVGCQSRLLWAATGGEVLPLWDALERIRTAGGNNYTFIGGDPMDQAGALGLLLLALRHFQPAAHIIIYTGYTYEELRTLQHDPATPENVRRGIRVALESADVLVDGRYVPGLDDDRIQWRGSRNQRPILLRATEQAGQIVVDESWDRPTLTIKKGSGGQVVGAAGLMRQVFADDSDRARMCGQVQEQA